MISRRKIRSRILYLKCRLCNAGLKLFWYRLFIRKDVFHPSLDLDVLAMLAMSPEKVRWYVADVMRRRDIAHRRDIERT
jgi:hypothetical protein